MDKIIVVCILLFISGCNTSKEKDQSAITTEDNKQNSTVLQNEDLNTTVPYGESVMLLGKADREGLQLEAFDSWFGPGYRSYNPDPEIMAQLEPLLKDVEIALFMGTWCEDSHRDVPHLYKILDELDFEESQLQVYATSEDKTTPQGFGKDKNIIQVPTIIFYKDGKEINRIVEYSIYTLEKDMLDILSGKDYRNPYSDT